MPIRCEREATASSRLESRARPELKFRKSVRKVAERPQENRTNWLRFARSAIRSADPRRSRFALGRAERLWSSISMSKERAMCAQPLLVRHEHVRRTESLAVLITAIRN